MKYRILSTARLSFPLVSALAAILAAPSLHAQATRTWGSTTGSAWLTTGSWSPSGTFAGNAPNAVVTGEGATTDIMAVTAANSATNVGINMNTLSGLLSLGGIDFNKTNANTLQIGNSSTTVNGILQLNGATINLVDKTLIRVAGSANLTIANVNSGTGTQTMGLRLGITDGIFDVAANRTLTINSIISQVTADSGFTKTGAGTLTLSGANTYSGSASITDGRLIVQSNANTADANFTSTALGSAAVDVGVNGTLRVNHDLDKAGRSLGFANAITGSGTLEFSSISAPATSARRLTQVGSLSSFTGAISVLANGNFLANTAGLTTNQNLTIATGGYFTISEDNGLGKLDGAGTVMRNAGTGTTRILTLGNNNATGGVFSGVIRGEGTGIFGSAGFISVTKVGTGTQTLSGANIYAGNTIVEGGTLALSGAGSIANSPLIQINSSTTLSVTGLSGSSITVGAAQTLTGNGTVLATGKTVGLAGTLAPGSSPGTITQDGGTMQLAVGGDYNWEILNASAAAGTGYDTTNLINGSTLDLSLLSAGNTYNINLWSLSGIGPDVNGNATNFDNTQTYSWTLFSTGTAITGFSTDLFTINTGAFNGTNGFTNALGSGSFSVSLADGGTDINLNFVPEPSAALLGSLGLLALLRRRRH